MNNKAWKAEVKKIKTNKPPVANSQELALSLSRPGGFYFGGKMRTWKYIVAVTILTIFTCQMVFAEDWSDIEIADAIYLAEGGAKAKVPYGILSVKIKDEVEARQVCLNTIRNNRKRYANYGYKQYPDYLSFLASRYCPIGVSNDPSNLNKNWLKNVRYFLEKNRRQNEP